MSIASKNYVDNKMNLGTPQTPQTKTIVCQTSKIVLDGPLKVQTINTNSFEGYIGPDLPTPFIFYHKKGQGQDQGRFKIDVNNDNTSLVAASSAHDDYKPLIVNDIKVEDINLKNSTGSFFIKHTKLNEDIVEIKENRINFLGAKPYWSGPETSYTGESGLLSTQKYLETNFKSCVEKNIVEQKLIELETELET